MNRIAISLASIAFAVGLACGGLEIWGQDKPLKVFLLAGQSNMQGHAHARTFPAIGLNPALTPLLAEMQAPDGSPRICERVWISSIGSANEERYGQLTVGFGAESGGPKIGPEFTFGIYMEKLLDEPILIIKTAWGGKSLHTDFRPPSAGPFVFRPEQLEGLAGRGQDIETVKAEKEQATGQYYRLMIEHVQRVTDDIQRVYPDYDPDQGFELAGFVWFQGWNDMVDASVYPQRNQPGGYDHYSELLIHLIRDLRNDLNAPDLPVVIGVMGVGGPVEYYRPERQREKVIHQNFRDAMAAPAALPEFNGTVRAVLTEKFWDREVVGLREREQEIKPQIDEINRQIEEGRTTREEGQAAIERLYTETFTIHELVILRESTSNADFRYMGSATIMAQIGKSFAEAMLGLVADEDR